MNPFPVELAVAAAVGAEVTESVVNWGRFQDCMQSFGSCSVGPPPEGLAVKMPGD